MGEQKAQPNQLVLRKRNVCFIIIAQELFSFSVNFPMGGNHKPSNEFSEHAYVYQITPFNLEHSILGNEFYSKMKLDLLRDLHQGQEKI